MKKSINRRKNYLRNRIFDEATRILCRKDMSTNSFSRDRKITFSDILLITLNKQGRNVSFEIRDYEINKKGEKFVNYTDEAYLKQRRNLNPEVFKKLNQGYLKDFYHEKKYVKKYKGYVVWAIDGSKEEIPNTKQNKELFGTVPGGKSKDKVARALMSGAYDVYNHFFGDVQICRATTPENKLAKKNITECLKINNNQKNLFIFDRNYPSIEMYEIFNENHSKFIMRLSVNDYINERKQMKIDDEIIEIKYTRYRKYHFMKKNPDIYEKIKDKDGIKLRIVNIKLNTGETESLITNILTNKFNKEDFNKLYYARWQIEESYNSLKNKLKIEKFTGKLPIFVYQDTYAQVLVYNQLQDMLKDGNERLREKNKEKNLQHKYQINENKAIGLYKEQLIRIMLIEDKENAMVEFDKLIEEMTKYVSIIRENRIHTERKFIISNKYHSNQGATF